MKVTFAQFHVEHDEKSYGVQMSVQYVTQNRTFVTVTIYAVNEEGVKRILTSFSGSGRQMISPSNAARFVRDALIAEGTIKPRPPEIKPEPARELELSPEEDIEINLREQKPETTQEILRMKTYSEIPTPGIIKAIKKFFSSTKPL